MIRRGLLLGVPAKTVCVVLLCVTLVTVPSGAMAAEIKDVPKDHWAYQAVKTLVDKGYLALYGDGTFQGGKPVDRYTLAVVIAKILNEIESGKVGATPEDVELLRKLSVEFRQELVQVANELDVFKKSLDEQGRAQAVMKEDIARLTFTQNQLRAEVEKMIADITASTGKNVATADQRAREAENELSARIDQNESRVGRLADDVAKGFSDTRASLEDLAGRMDASDKGLAGRLDAHDAKLAQLDEDLSAAILRLSTLEPQVALVTDGLVAAKKDLGRNIDALKLDLASARSDIATLQEGFKTLDASLGTSVAQLNESDAKLQEGLDAVTGKALTLEDSLATERAARLSTDTSLQTALADLASDLAATKAQTAKDVDSLRKENALLKILLAAVAILGIVIK
ncbi:MAG: S-layer homology domain-containing protein [Betaproteobacteria bacterium]